jgi:hypothetical protein
VEKAALDSVAEAEGLIDSVVESVLARKRGKDELGSRGVCGVYGTLLDL